MDHRPSGQRHPDSIADVSESPAAKLASYVSAVQFEDIPASAIDTATLLVEDTIGCAIGAMLICDARPIVDLAERHPGGAVASLIGGEATSVTSAVFCNAQLANLLDFDDMHDHFMPYHPGCVIVPTALAVAESIGATGRDFLTAVTAAYEVVMRVGRAMGNGLWVEGLPLGPLAELCAGIAAAKLYELDAPKIRSLFSIIAMDEIGPPPRRVKSDLPAHVRLGSLKGNYGSFAQVGLWAAMKARAGMTGRPGYLESSVTDWYRAGFPPSLYCELTAGLGREYVIGSMSLKPTPSCRVSHLPITAAWDALRGRTLDARNVTRIRIIGVPRLERTQWRDMFDAQFSVPCSLALTLSGLEPGPKWYVNGAFGAPDILELAGKMVQERDPAAEQDEILQGRTRCRIEIELRNGETLCGECAAMKGSPENPLTSAERQAKFAANTAHLGGSRAQEIGAAIRGLAGGGPIADLTRALAISNVGRK